MMGMSQGKNIATLSSRTYYKCITVVTEMGVNDVESC